MRHGFCIFLLLLCAAILQGCVKEISLPYGETGDAPSKIVVNISVRNPAAPLTRSGSLGPESGEYTLGYTEAESRINSLTLIMMSVDASGSERFEVSQTVGNLSSTTAGYSATFELTGRSGTKRFYLGANMQTRHIGAFTVTDAGRQRVFDMASIADFSDPTNPVNPASALVAIDADGAGSDIVMAAPLTWGSGAETTIDITPGTAATLRPDPVSLTRTVAKVLLTCTLGANVTGGESGVDYANVVDFRDVGKPGAENTGWVRLSDVSYMVNGFNRKAYLDFRLDADGKVQDPNYLLSDWVEERDVDPGHYGLRDLAAYNEDFHVFGTAQMVQLLGSDDKPSLSANALKYDAARIGDGNSDQIADAGANHYTEGLYCPENVYKIDISNFPTDDADQIKNIDRLVGTHLMVASCYVPKKIYVVENGALVEKAFATESDAIAALTNQSDSYGTYAPDTFWYDSIKGDYYTFQGMSRKLQEEPTTAFSRYDGGVGYYYAPIGVEQSSTEAYRGVVRNHYYIVNALTFVAPGAAYPDNGVIRIHSETIDWYDKGSSEVEIEL